MRDDVRTGKMTAIYLPAGLDEMLENTRKKLGMNRSKFIQYCVLKVLQEINVVTSTVHDRS